MVREAITAELNALPFLGNWPARPPRSSPGSIEELVFTYTVGQSGIADSGWLKLCFRFYSDWDLQTDRSAGARLRLGAVGQPLAGRRRVGELGGHRAATQHPLRRQGRRAPVPEGAADPRRGRLPAAGRRRSKSGWGTADSVGPGTRVQTFVEDEFEFHLFVDPLGTSRMARAGVSRLAVVPGPPERLVVHGPRLVRADAPTADLRLHLQDRWGNACRDVTAAVARLASAEMTVAAADFPTAGWAAVTRVGPGSSTVASTSSHEAGIGGDRRENCYLDVIDDFPSPRALFADLHVHSNDTVGTQDTASNLTTARRRRARRDRLHRQRLPDHRRRLGRRRRGLPRRQRGRQTRLLSRRRVVRNAGVGGDHNVVFLGEDTTLARSLEWHEGMASPAPVPQTWPITELYAAYDKDPEYYLLIPHVGGRRAMLDWHHPELERLIEVHSSWGTSPWFFEDALARGLRLGASAASDEHRGRPGGGAPGRQHLRRPRRADRRAGARAHPRATSVGRCGLGGPGRRPAPAPWRCCAAASTGWATRSTPPQMNLSLTTRSTAQRAGKS